MISYLESKFSLVSEINSVSVLVLICARSVVTTGEQFIGGYSMARILLWENMYNKTAY